MNYDENSTITNVHAYNAGEACDGVKRNFIQRQKDAEAAAYDAKQRRDWRIANPQNFDADGNRIKKW